ncbi:MAG: hypothetical protein HOL66_05405 [Rhodospirillaceae bacterium]|nr:hypothetical protein [Rhodospirillaceae bacterium]MBT5243660.1 hypothetical protein [Rhodospirillaceae bacterium]MBT5561960.1 hypothetical protein [Rhodospirillaceae bacterium]MBT6240417.1 hypothetical protein [Rhodospirillaceae bacterium]MBT7137392.1 hypothetical protein [Rhodospirillaceae bacterium]
MAKLTSEILDEIKASFERVGGEAYLDELAMRDPPTFCRLLGLVVQSEIKAEMATKINHFNLGGEMAKANFRLAKPEDDK